VDCQSEEDVSGDPGDISVQFQDAKDGKELNDMILDIGERQKKP